MNKKEKGSKGLSLKYEEKLQMANYLCPNGVLSVAEQRRLFETRSRVNPLPANKGETSLCPTGCGHLLDNEHILNCWILNPEEQYSIDSLINGNIHEMKKFLQKWNRNVKNIEEITSPDSI